jgi:hypothetical protein
LGIGERATETIIADVIADVALIKMMKLITDVALIKMMKLILEVKLIKLLKRSGVALSV